MAIVALGRKTFKTRNRDCGMRITGDHRRNKKNAVNDKFIRNKKNIVVRIIE